MAIKNFYQDIMRFIEIRHWSL